MINGTAAGFKPRCEWSAGTLTTCLIGCCLAGSDRISTPPTAPQDCDKSPRNRRTKVNTAFVILLDADRENDVSLFNHRLLFLRTPTHQPRRTSSLLLLPYKYCLRRLFLSCIQYYSMHFQPSHSDKYLVYRLLMFIQSTGLHCLGEIARQGPFGEEKENLFQMKSNDSCRR